MTKGFTIFFIILFTVIALAGLGGMVALFRFQFRKRVAKIEESTQFESERIDCHEERFHNRGYQMVKGKREKAISRNHGTL